MNTALLATWLAALRSGSYPKGRDMLRCDRKGWRAVGVLMDVVDSKGWARDRFGAWRWHGAAVLAPNWLLAAVGWDHAAEYQVDTADFDAASFAALADWLERVVPVDADADAERSPRPAQKFTRIRTPKPLKLGRAPAKIKRK
jgi:hypothetical protein